MGDIRKLQSILKEIDDLLIGCMRCGMCQSVCPLFAETLNEGDVARGKIALLDSLASKMISDVDGVKARIEKCLLCGSCAANCPSGVQAGTIFLKARAALTEYAGLSPAKKLIFRGTLSHPKLFNRLLDVGTRFQGLMLKNNHDVQGTSCAPLLSGILGDRHMVRLATTPFHKAVPKLDTPAGKSGLKVAFYPGCVVDKAYPKVAADSLKILRHHGVGVFMPKDQGCCGMPALASGDRLSFERLLAYNIALFEKGDFDYLVTPCATCTSTLKKLWPKMARELGMKKADVAVALSEKVLDISQFLVDHVGIEPVDAAAAGSRTVTYHDPCHLGKGLGVYSQPRTLIRASRGCTLTEMTEADYCCGSGGSFNLQHYAESNRIGERKRGNIVATGAEIAATSCPACMMQMTDMLSKNGDPVKVKHVVELYADSL